LCGVPGADVAASVAALRRLGIVDDVSNDESLTASVLEGLAQDDVNLEYGLSVEATLAVYSAVSHERGVERIKVFASEATERDVPDPWDDMTLDVAPVAVPGAWSKSDLLSRQPRLE
jgi:hypothetical protein